MTNCFLAISVLALAACVSLAIRSYRQSGPGSALMTVAFCCGGALSYRIGPWLLPLLLSFGFAKLCFRAGIKSTALWLVPVAVLGASIWTAHALLPAVSYRQLEWLSTGSCLLVALALWVDVALWPRRKAKAGSLLFELEKPNPSRSICVFCGALVFAGIMLLGVLREFTRPLFERHDSASPFFCLSVAFFALSFAVPALVEGFRRLEVRERGLLYFNDLIRWEQIGAYQWDTECPELLVAEVRRRLPLSTTVGGQVILYIPSPYRIVVDSILARRSQRPAQT